MIPPYSSNFIVIGLSFGSGIIYNISTSGKGSDISFVLGGISYIMYFIVVKTYNKQFAILIF